MKFAAKNTINWLALTINALLTCIWAYWGIIENFHEGWYYQSLARNLSLMLVQYLPFPLLLMVLSGIAIRWNRLGGILYLIAAILVPIKFNTSAAWVIFAIPLCITGILYFFFPIHKKRSARLLVIGLPLVIMVTFGIEPIYRISTRPDRDSTESTTLAGNNIELTWAPEGPGWPGSTQELTYKSWDDVVYICSHLSEDGKTITNQELNIWRLPTVEEVASSLTRHGKNAGGVWNNNEAKASYQIKPDKEAPLWKVHSPIIYWWTSTEVNDSTVYRIVYNGTTQKVSKKLRMGSLGFRAVKEPTSFQYNKLN